MNKSKRITRKLGRSALMVIALSAITSMSAADNGKSTTNQGATPNGKPFDHINEQLDAQAEKIFGLQIQLDDITAEVATINADIDGLETRVDENTDAISAVSADLATTNQNLAALRAETESDIDDLQGQIDSLQLDINDLEGALNALTAQLALQLIDLQAAIDDNSANISSLMLDVTSLNAQILVLGANVDNATTRLTSLEFDLDALSQLVASLDIRLISVESFVHSHGFPASCSEILADDPGAVSGMYSIDPDGPDGEGAFEPIEAYCDMETNGGGWTNLDFAANQIILENGNLINCDSLTFDSNSITCTAPLFNNDSGPESKYLYHYYCSGVDPAGAPQSADYLVDHVGRILGHQNTLMLGTFNNQSTYNNGVHGYSDGNNKEYCYIDGEVVEWDSAQCAVYNSRGNGNCVPGTFTLSQ